ncbi:GNAT family N-acetyltransferase [Pelagibius litoralis]|uniref:GNAT family N-acetyltransferase n=1 Tax=Pelagibius litoralis TaxID=374515 RepID=A0A967F389_9PROT|nr:GNAT family N-acetyltransferase [Pelagibius litoralis]NIA72066.1 GNAT family N-acetyltransferase [Pelagibius litoralis]
MSKLNFEIRPFTETDLPILHEVREAAFVPVFRSFRAIVGEDIAQFTYAEAETDQGAHLDEMCQTGSRHHVYIATADSQVIGCCGYTIDPKRKVGQIGLNAVHPDYQGRNVGTALYEYVLAKMKEEGMSVATVGTGGDASHKPARRAYLKAGFETSIPSLLLCRML